MAFRLNPLTGNLDLVGTSGGGGGTVTSVNGQIGAVVLDTDDINEGAINLYYTDARVLAAVANTPNTFAGYDNSGALYSIPDWNINQDTGGVDFTKVLTPADAGSPETQLINRFTSIIAPTANLINLSFQGFQNYHRLQGPFDFNSFQGISNAIDLEDTGNHGFITGTSQTINFGDGTNASTSESGAINNNSATVRALHTVDTGFIGDLTSLQVNAGGTVDYIQGLSYSIQVDGTVDSGITLFNGNITTSVDLPATVGINNSYITANITGDAEYFNGYIIGGNLNTGTDITNGIQVFQDSLNINNGTTASYYSSAQLTPHIYPTADIGGFTGLNVNPLFESTLSDSVTLANLSIDGNSLGSVPSLTGLNVNLSQLDSPNKKLAINTQGGAFNAYYEASTGDFTFSAADSINNLGGVFHIAAGSPITGGEFVFGNNIGHQVLIEDDMGVDSLGGLIGFSMDGMAGQVAVADTKTLDTLNFLVSGASVPTVAFADNGTITNVSFFRALGLIPSGGALQVTNMYGFKADSLLDAAAATNTWGIHVAATTAENYLNKSLVIGGITEKVTNADVALEIADEKALLHGRMDTTTRDALTPVEGMEIYNTTTQQLEYYDGATWVGPAGAAITGSGTATQLTFWSGASSVTSDADFSVDTTTNSLNLGQGTDILEIGVLSSDSIAAGAFTDSLLFTYPDTNRFAIVDYSIERSTNLRVGSLWILHNGSTVSVIDTYQEMGTTDINLASPGVTHTLSGGNVEIRATSTGGAAGTFKKSIRRWN